MPVLCIKNSIGEDLIGNVESDLQGNIIIEHPFMIAIVQSDTANQFKIGMMPYLQFSEDAKFVFKKEDILLQYTPAIDLANQYRQITGKIVIAKPELTLLK